MFFRKDYHVNQKERESSNESFSVFLVFYFRVDFAKEMSRAKDRKELSSPLSQVKNFPSVAKINTNV